MGAAIDFLTRTGQITDERRQEFVLLSDVLGASMQVIGVNHPADTDQTTESTVFGPFFLEGSPAFPNGDDISGGAAGTPCFISGSVLGADGEPVPGARVEVWEADEEGLYDVQHEGGEVQGRGHLHTDETGRFFFWAVKPDRLPDPGRRPGRRAAGGRRARPDAARPRPLHGPRGGPRTADHPRLRGRRPLPRRRRGVRRQELADRALRAPRGGDRAPDGSVPEEAYSTMSYDLRLGREASGAKEEAA